MWDKQLEVQVLALKKGDKKVKEARIIALDNLCRDRNEIIFWRI